MNDDSVKLAKLFHFCESTFLDNPSWNHCIDFIFILFIFFYEFFFFFFFFFEGLYFQERNVANANRSWTFVLKDREVVSITG